jgi:hypothetical protein
MQVTTYEGIIENGTIRLIPNVSLPERMRVYVVVPSMETTPVTRIVSPRLVHPEQAADFVKGVQLITTVYNHYIRAAKEVMR